MCIRDRCRGLYRHMKYILGRKYTPPLLIWTCYTSPMKGALIHWPTLLQNICASHGRFRYFYPLHKVCAAFKKSQIWRTRCGQWVLSEGLYKVRAAVSFGRSKPDVKRKEGRWFIICYVVTFVVAYKLIKLKLVYALWLDSRISNLAVGSVNMELFEVIP